MATTETFLERMYFSAEEETITSLVLDPTTLVAPPVPPTTEVVLLPGILTVLVQTSEDGESLMNPVYSITWNGLTFSTLVASGCSIQPTELYFRVIAFPVF